VGIIDLAVNASNYLAAGVNIAGKTPFVGRFTPAYFEQTINSQGMLKGEHFNGVCENENWVYTGQKTVENASGVYQSTDTKGAIRYLIPPVIDITAYNRSGSITQNYTSAGFIKFSNLQQTSSSNPHIITTAPTTDDTAPQSLTASMSLGADPIEKNNSAQTMPVKGVVSYTFNNTDNYFYDHISSAEVAEFFAKIPFVIASITDSDGVMLNTATGATPTVKVVTQGASPGLGVRFGRWAIENGYGPETSDLTVAMPIQYFNGSYYVTNDLENCTVPTQGTRDNANINSGNMAATYNYRLADNDLSDTLTPADTAQTLLPLNSGANPLRFYQGLYRFLSFSAVGNGAAGNNKKGRLDFEYQVPPWLQYDWNGNTDNDDAYDQNPTAILTFGLYRGNDRIIYQRERFD
jgi:MSHA biogenesis protein MshQ